MEIQVDLPPKGPLLTKRDYEAKLSPFDRMIAAMEEQDPFVRNEFGVIPLPAPSEFSKMDALSMTPPTESELDKLQSRIDMRFAANSALNSYRLGDRPFTTEIAIVSRCVLKLLDEIEELETTIITQACDIAEYQRENEKRAKPTYTFVEFGELMQEGDEYWSSTLEDWIAIEFSTGRQMANKGCVMRRKVS